ncbi:MAG: SDR family oxidoreductase [Hyphomicrobiaceae bacterium]|nr:SDR family oxidoreductase [Hyphomicrobiaceae bacterium]
MILVTGATGQLGRLIVSELRKILPAGEGLAASVRDPAKAAALKDQGVDVRQADFDDKASLAKAFAGVTRLLIVSGDAPNAVRIRQHRSAIDAAKDAGVDQVAYTSFVDHDPASPFSFAAIHHDTESYLSRSGLSYTVLRNGMYADMLHVFAGTAASGVFAAPAGDGKVSFVTRADLARATARVLASDRYAGQTLLLAGEKALSFSEIAALLARQLGHPVRYDTIDRGVYEAALKKIGLPDFLAEAIGGIHVATAEGRNAETSTAIRAITGEAPEDVASFLRRTLPRAAA